MNRVVLIFVLFRLSNFLMFNLFGFDSSVDDVSLKDYMIKNQMEIKTENLNKLDDLLAVER